MNRSAAELYLADVRSRAARLKSDAERAATQVDDEHFFARLGSDENSIATLFKHLGGNLRSRWTDFLTTDGEKPDRRRDAEFESGADTRESILEVWEAGWAALLGTLDGLDPGYLDHAVRIRGEPHTVIEALNRQLVHTASHVGQIVLLAKHFAGPAWQTLSIPRGESDAYFRRLLRDQGG